MISKVLFTQWFNASVEVQTYNLYCLYKNLGNPAISYVVLFVDDPHFRNVFGEKLSVVKWPTRLTYNDWIEHAQKYHPDAIKILANSDVFLNATLDRVNTLTWDNDVYVISRRDVTRYGHIRKSTVYYGGTEFLNPRWSQDCWMYRNPLPTPTKEIHLGVMHCENHFREDMQKQGVKFHNLTGLVDCHHVDWRTDKPRTITDYSVVRESAVTPHAPYAFE
jgi:hypothetical protein